MDRALTIDSLKLLQDWSKWLVALETFICANLWPRLTVVPNPPAVPKPPTSLYVGWMMFWASIVTAAVLLAYLSVVVRRVTNDGEVDLSKVKLLVGAESAFFLAGLLCFAWRMAHFW